jgi:Tripartite tricarboxylate transporter family receptor
VGHIIYLSHLRSDSKGSHPVVSHTRREFLHSGAAIVAGLLPLKAVAQQWPSRPIRLVVPFPPGAAADSVPRLVAQRLTERLGQQVFVDNRSGAGGNIGTQSVARANADGYTLLGVPGSTLTVNPILYKDAGFDPVKDLSPVTQLVKAPFVLVFLRSHTARSSGSSCAPAPHISSRNSRMKLLRWRASANRTTRRRALRRSSNGASPYSTAPEGPGRA